MPRKKLPTKAKLDQAEKPLWRAPNVGKQKRGDGHTVGAVSAVCSVPDPRDLIDAIRAAHRERCFAMEQRKRCDLALGAFLRTGLGWRRDLSDDLRKAIAKRADDLIFYGETTAKGKDSKQSKDPLFDNLEPIISAALSSRAPWDAIESGALKQMERLAMMLPVWPTFGEPIRGFGPASLAVIVAEAGDLSNYATKSKLWKRMGVAVMGAVRQGGLPKNASAESWIEHGYDRQRRSRLWNIGDALIKGNRAGKYRQCYLKRKEYELARDPEMKPIKAHRRAQRYMEKRLLRDLWQAWRAGNGMAHEKVSTNTLPSNNRELRREPPEARNIFAQRHSPNGLQLMN